MTESARTKEIPTPTTKEKVDLGLDWLTWLISIASFVMSLFLPAQGFTMIVMTRAAGIIFAVCTILQLGIFYSGYRENKNKKLKDKLMLTLFSIVTGLVVAYGVFVFISNYTLVGLMLPWVWPVTYVVLMGMALITLASSYNGESIKTASNRKNAVIDIVGRLASLFGLFKYLGALMKFSGVVGTIVGTVISSAKFFTALRDGQKVTVAGDDADTKPLLREEGVDVDGDGSKDEKRETSESKKKGSSKSSSEEEEGEENILNPDNDMLFDSTKTSETTDSEESIKDVFKDLCGLLKIYKEEPDPEVGSDGEEQREDIEGSDPKVESADGEKEEDSDGEGEAPSSLHK